MKQCGIRLTKPLVSSDQLRTMMIGKTIIKLSSLKSKINQSLNSIDYDWVTIAVIVNKATKVSKNGNDYSIWNLSDLQSENLVSFFLFGSVHDKHWKLPPGSVIGLLNASFMKDNNNKNAKQISTITIDDPDKLLHIGTAKDLGYCKAIKKNGDICGSMIMRAEDDFCMYHIKNAYRKFSSKRADIQSSFSNKEPEQYHFANNYVPNASLNKNNIQLTTKNINKEQLDIKKIEEKKVLENLTKNPISRAARSLASITNKTNIKENDSLNDKLNMNLTAKEILAKVEMDVKPAKTDSPMLAKGYRKGQMIDLGMMTMNSKKVDNQPTVDINKLKAIEIFKNKQNNSVKLVNGKLTMTNKKFAQIMNKVNENLKESNEELKREIAEAENANKELINQAMKRKSLNDNSIARIENNEMEKHYQQLERREKYENRLADIKELNVKVVTCTICKYTASSQSELCRSKNHPVQFHEAKKRFFQCKQCNYRKCTFDSVIPIGDCPKCGRAFFEKASIIKVILIILIFNFI